jgi:predicted ribosomally synthesized peptide with SipW-like signal peptide
MTTKKKALAAIIAVCLIVCLTAGASLAYLTDTKSVTNTFTVGNVNITLAEPSYEKDTAHKLVPGDTTAKDPTVTVVKGSETCYVRVKVTVTMAENFADVAAVKDLFNIQCGWEFKSSSQPDDKSTYTLIYNFKGTESQSEKVDASDADVKLPAVFTTVKCPTWVTSDNASTVTSDFKITVTAEAIQSASFTSADDAWSNFVAPTTPTAGTTTNSGTDNT